MWAKFVVKEKKQELNMRLVCLTIHRVLEKRLGVIITELHGRMEICCQSKEAADYVQDFLETNDFYWD